MKKLLITYDYELFLGNRSGNIQDCLLKPTLQTIAVLKKYNARAIFFVDTTYLLQLKKRSDVTACKKDFDRVTEQLRQLIQAGHYVFPHLHPHWLDAEYLKESNEWRLNEISKYRFHNITDSEKQEVFDGSLQLLKEIIYPVNPDYKIDCYRAGGWCIQPFKDFKPYFEKHNFKYDMSVLGGFYLFSNAQYFDFSSAPGKEIYHFEDDVVSERSDGRYTQFNISSVTINGVTDFLDKVWLKYQYKIKGDHTFTRGQGQIAVKTDMQKPTSQRGYDISVPGRERIAVELLTRIKLPVYLRFMNQHNYMHFISHPKMLTNHNNQMFDKFLGKVHSEYKIETDFRKMV